MLQSRIAVLLILLSSCAELPAAPATAPTPTTAPTTQSVGKLPHIVIDVKARQVRVECNSVKADYPLEFLAVVSNTNEYEALVRSDARPSDLHLALLMIGLKPGQPAHRDETGDKWVPPSGPLVNIRFEYDQDAKHITVPASQWMMDINTKKPPEDFQWCFTGSKFSEGGEYGGDAAGQLIGVVNNDLAVLDVPHLQSRDIDSRQWSRNTAAMPPGDTPVTMVITPAQAPATTNPAPDKKQ